MKTIDLHHTEQDFFVQELERINYNKNLLERSLKVQEEELNILIDVVCRTCNALFLLFS